MKELYEWLSKWNIPVEAIDDLRAIIGIDVNINTDEQGLNESTVMSKVRLEAVKKGVYLWRNNVGVLQNERGVPIRYGLANESKAVNLKFKSADLIGIRPLLITKKHVGFIVGQFVSREIKKSNWVYSGTEREEAQLKWANLIISLGGDAAFATGEGTL